MTDQRPGGLLRKTLWFVGLWAAGVVTVGVGAEALKLLIFGHTH
ncbi:DUF2474 domain-containing protein [Tanticharoenia sakaeratensis]|jgi:hypothetical protein|nr:DUF2474 domain-containing protein [Tanticharoenia sakaeratensis]GBQ17129.1 hypothetical protein AA103193_0231 [Tanticharoenia sakaeratensis NBRC 103193]